MTQKSGIDRINNVREAIEFKNPDYIPLELIKIPGSWDEYMTLSGDEVDKDFDALKDFDIAEVYYSWLLWKVLTDTEIIKAKILYLN